MSKKKLLIYFALILFIINGYANSIENKILVKIENEIITSIDIDNEYKYLLALNPGIKNLNEDDKIKFSKKSIIQEKIKKIEIEKNFNNPNIPPEFLEQILRSVYSKIGIESLANFKKYLINKNINFKDVKNKLVIEALWNELILIKFSSKIKINEKKLKKKLMIIINF